MLDFSFETWQGDTGLTLGDPLPYWAESLLYEQTGLSPYLKKSSSQCSLSSAMFNSTAINGNGWVNGKYYQFHYYLSILNSVQFLSWF